MIYRFIALNLLLMLAFQLSAQIDTKAYRFIGIVYDEDFKPLPYTHVIASGTGQGDVTDSLGVFILYIREHDKLSFFNIAFFDTLVMVEKSDPAFYIKLKRRAYLLTEAKIFQWGSTYEEFMDEVKRQGAGQTVGAKMNLPTQTPGAIPYDLDDAKIKSVGFFLTSPISFLYHNYSKREIGARKAFELEQNEDLIKTFEETLSQESISGITGLEGEDLQVFMIYLNTHLNCTYTCGEIELLTEIFAIWKRYKTLDK